MTMSKLSSAIMGTMAYKSFLCKYDIAEKHVCTPATLILDNLKMTPSSVGVSSQKMIFI